VNGKGHLFYEPFGSNYYRGRNRHHNISNIETQNLLPFDSFCLSEALGMFLCGHRTFLCFCTSIYYKWTQIDKLIRIGNTLKDLVVFSTVIKLKGFTALVICCL